MPWRLTAVLATHMLTAAFWAGPAFA